MILIHAADLHLGSPLGGLDQHEALTPEAVRRIREAPMRAFERLGRLCEERGAGLLVLAGDLFDGDASIATMREAAQVLERICRAGTRVVTIRGNHDAESRLLRSLPTIDGLHELSASEPETVLLQELGVAVHGRGFDRQHVDENIVPSYPAPVPGVLNVGVLHTSLAGAAGHDRYAPCSVDDLVAKGYGYWALGHVHQRTVYCEQPWIIHAGNTQGRDVGECGARGATVVEYDGAQVVGTPEHVELDGVRWTRLAVTVGAEEPADALVDRIGDQLRDAVATAPELVHVVRVDVDGRGAAHAALAGEPVLWRGRLHDAALDVSPDGLYLERVRFRTLPQLPERDELLAREDVVGDAARDLLAGAAAPPGLEDAFAHLERKLAPLAGDGAEELLPALTDADLDAAREALLSRLLVAHAEEAEAAR